MVANTRPTLDADRYGPKVEIRVLGQVEVLLEGTPAPLGGPKQRAVLAVLISHVDNAVSVDHLVDSVWGEVPPTAVRNSLHTYISNLRSILDGNIERTGSGYQLLAEPSEVDANVFEQSTDEGRSSLSANPSRAVETLRSGLSLWRGRPYADLIDVPGLQAEIRRLENLRELAVEARIDADLAIGRHRAVLGELEALTVEHPLNEGLRARQMLALYRDGRQADALRAYQQTRDTLAAELGVDPSPDLQRMEERILLHDPDLLSGGDSRMEEIAFLFTDLEGSTALWETRPEQMREALSRHDEILSNAVTEAGGRVFKHTGDGVLAAFTSVAEAAKGATEAQVALNTTNWGSIGPLNVRMSVDVGEVDVRGGDYFGAPMNRGARLMSSAHGGQIILSAAAHEKLDRQAGVQIKNLGEHRFKGLGAPQQVFQLVVEGLDQRFPELRTDAAAPGSGREFGDAIRGYEIRERIGVGRFGVVYRAYQPTVGREVAVKVIRPEFANHPSFVRRFESEARIVAKLEHPHIVSLFDFWRDHEGAYLVMPYLAGKSLAGAPYGAMPLDRVAEILRQVGAALSYAHRQGVIHRDVKPANLLLDADGNAYLADFGIAVRAVEQATGLLPSSQVFRAPEEREGGVVDERTDVYSLAAITAEMLTGIAPPDADLSTLSTNLAAVIARGMAIKPANRYASIDDFLASFTLAIGHERKRPTRPVQTRNPYKGLAAFDEIDARDFFGRDTEVADLLDLVAEGRFVTVVGPSGSGKSSLVRAGLLPTLRAGGLPESANWLIVTMVPGAHPFDELAIALGEVATDRLGDLAAELRSDEHGLLRVSKKLMHDLDGELVVLIDQFEELYSLAGDDEITKLFIESLLEATADPRSRLRVVATVRADYFDKPLLDDRLGPIIAGSNLALSVPGPESLREAIDRPAKSAGVDLEAGLAAQIVADVRDEPGGLPLMQFALADLVRLTAGRVALSDYTASGGVTGALSSRADEVYGALGDADRDVAEQIFLRLVSVSDDAGDVRRRVRRSELESLGYDAGSVGRVLDAFGEVRLLTFDRDPVTRGPTAEVAHEALLREWDQYRDWIDAQRASLLTRRRFELAMQEWETAGRPDDLLPTSGRLAQFEEWSAGTRLPEPDQRFLDAAITQRETERADRRKGRRRVLIGFAAAAAVAIVLAVAALVQRSSATQEASLANARSLILEAEKNVDVDPELSVLLAIEAIEAFQRSGDVPATAITALRDGVGAIRVRARFPGGEFVSVDSTGTRLVTSSPDGGVTVLDIESGATLQSIRTNDAGGKALDAWYGSSGRLLVNFEEPGAQFLEAHIFDEETSQWLPIPGSRVDRGGVHSLAWDDSSDGTLFATLSRGVLTVIDLDSGETLYTRPLPEGGGFGFSADGRIAYAVNDDGQPSIAIVEARTGERLQTIRNPYSTPTFFSFSPDGNRLAIATQTSAGMVDLASELVPWFVDDIDRTNNPLWMVGGDDILVGGEGLFKILDAVTGDVIRQLAVHRGGSFSYQLIPGTDLLASAGLSDGETLITSVGSGLAPEIGLFASPIDGPLKLTIDQSGQRLLMRDHDTHAVLDATDGSLLMRNTAQDADLSDNFFRSSVISSNGVYVAGHAGDGTYRVWLAETEQEVYAAPVGWHIVGVSDDGSLAIIHSDTAGGPDEGVTQIMHTRPGGSVQAIDAGVIVHFAEFSPDGAYVLTNNNNTDGNEATILRLWAVRDGRIVAEWGAGAEGTLSGWWSQFSKDGSWLVVGGYEGLVYVFDFEELVATGDAGGALELTISAHDNFIVDVRISPDGSMISSSSWDEPAKLWDLASGEPLGTFGTKGRTAIAFHPIEPWFYVVEGDTVAIHTLDIDELRDIAQSRLTRALTAEECLLYLDRECDDPA